MSLEYLHKYIVLWTLLLDDILILTVVVLTYSESY